MPKETVIVTRHPALVEYIWEQGLAPEGTEVLTHVSKASQIKGKDVIGVLPMHLAIYARTVTEIPLNVPEKLRGKELSLEQVRLLARHPRTYVVFDAEYDGQAFVEAASAGGNSFFPIEYAKEEVLKHR